MAFKVKKDDEKPKFKLVTFRLPEEMISELQKVAEKEEISTTKLVRQMIRHCLDDYKRK